MKQQVNYNGKQLTLETLIKESYKGGIKNKMEDKTLDEYMAYYRLYLSFLINASFYRAKADFDLLPAKIFMHYDWKELFKLEIIKTSDKILTKAKEINLNLFFFADVNNRDFVKVEEYPKEWLYIEEIEDALKLSSNYVKFTNRLISGYHFHNFKYDDIYVFNSELGIFNDKYRKFILALNDFITKFYNEKEEDSFDSLLFKVFYNLDNYLVGFGELTKLLAMFYYLFFLQTTLKNGKLNLLQIETNLAGAIRWNMPIYDEYNNLNSYASNSQKHTSFKSFKNTEALQELHSFLMEKKLIKEVDHSSFQKIFSNSELKESEKLEWLNTKKLLAYLINKLREEDYISISDNLWQKAEYCFKNQKAINLKSTFQDIKDFQLPKGHEIIDAFFI